MHVQGNWRRLIALLLMAGCSSSASEGPDQRGTLAERGQKISVMTSVGQYQFF